MRPVVAWRGVGGTAAFGFDLSTAAAAAFLLYAPPVSRRELARREELCHSVGSGI